MIIFCNEQPIKVADCSSLLQILLETEYAHQKGIAVAVNNCVVKKQNWEEYQLRENDKILIVSATKGG